MRAKLKVENQAGIKKIIFNCSTGINTIDLVMARTLAGVAKEIRKDKKTRVIVLEAKGSTFLLGGDLKYFLKNQKKLDVILPEILDCFHSFIFELYMAPIPVIAKIDGSTGGAGVSLILACDFSIASQSATFAFGYQQIGVSPDGGATWFLPRLIGLKQTKRLLFLSRIMTGMELQNLGLLTEVVPAQDLDCRVKELTNEIIGLSSRAVSSTKKLLNSEGEKLANHLEREKKKFLFCAKSKDFAEGMAAFVKKRAPKFEP